LIDEFLTSEPESVLLTLLFTTRTARKSEDTLQTLQYHVDRHATKSAQQRVHLQPESVELTSLLSVRSLARKLVASDIPHLNAVVLNAGIGGWSGLNWPMAVKTVLADIRRATTWPTFKLGVVGLIARPQFPSLSDGTRIEEPALAEVFTANVFGHYMLAHWLMPLLWACNEKNPGKLVWVSSIEASSRNYNPNDPQGFLSSAAYEHSKRVTDYLALTHTSPATQKSVNTFLAPPPQNTRHKLTKPTIQVSQPGIVVTTIVSLYWIVHQAYLLAILFARLLGAPWSTVTPYTAAASATFLALASEEVLESKELEGARSGELVGPGKWGTAVSRLGTVTVRRTDVDGWGLDGTGEPFAHSWWGGPSWWAGGQIGRATGAKDATREDVEAFVEQGASVWKMMEEMRVEWEGRLEDWNKFQRKDMNGNA
jgi:3-keto steroid reductase